MNRLPTELLTMAAVLAIGTAGLGADVWTDPAKAKAEDPDFAIQGEYGSAKAGVHAWGVQVMADGGGSFRAFALRGGLPGAGWLGKRTGNQQLSERFPMRGQREGEATTFTGSGFSAEVRREAMILVAEGKSFTLPRVERQSKTLGVKAPDGAVILFDQAKASETVKNWKSGRITSEGLLLQGTESIREFGSHRLHLEFRTPYKPKARGQGRGNSGLYVQGKFETQILDSFGLTGEMNEAGGVYSIAHPPFNACLPPLSWQTYDIEFTAAKFEKGKKIQSARMTVHLNGLLLHKNLKLNHKTTAAPRADDEKPGPVYLQNHGNPVRFRNIWVVPR